MVDEYEATSDETHAEFAARHGVEKTTFERWLYLLRGERTELAVDKKVGLLPVQVAVGEGWRRLPDQPEDGAVKDTVPEGKRIRQ
jgi:hypothetical protein